MEVKKNLLILVDWFAPGYRAGGPIQSCVNVAFTLKDRYHVKVFTSDTDYGVPDPYPGIESNQWTNELDPAIQVYYAKNKSLSLRQIKAVLQEAGADFIYLNHLFSPRFVVYPLWLKWRGLIKGMVVVCPRGALYQSALSVKRYKKMPFLFLFRRMGIHKMVRFHATNEREQAAILEYFPGSEVLIADNLPNSRQPAFRQLQKIPGVLKCIFIARIHPIKNVLFLLQVLKQVKGNIDLSIIGPMEEAAYWEKCTAAIAELPAGIQVNYMGAVANHRLPALLQEHHLFILPTTGENFGHSIFESFLAGRPVLISDQTPWLNLEKEKAGWALPLNNASAFVEKIEVAVAWDQAMFDDWSNSAWLYASCFLRDKVKIEDYTALFSGN